MGMEISIWIPIPMGMGVWFFPVWIPMGIPYLPTIQGFDNEPRDYLAKFRDYELLVLQMFMLNLNLVL